MRAKPKPRRVLLALFGMGFFAWIVSVLADKIDDTSDRESSHERDHIAPFPDDSFRNIFWFMQVTDIHVSIYHDRQRIADFERFCTEVVHTVGPELVLVTGDLTDAKLKDLVGSEQIVWEWSEYDRLLRETGVTESTVWLDVRGNHDAFNVPHLNHKYNYFRTHSHQGHKHPRHYKYTHVAPHGSYNFIAVDACPDPGLKRPYNFFGVMDESSMSELLSVSKDVESGNHTLFFGHYPSSTVISESPGLPSVLRGGTAYLTGHLHTLGGLVPNMYSMQKAGYLELECGDWKDNRIFRVLAMDHDMLSFIDTSLDDWPIILVTNPKNGHFNAPIHEPIGRIAHSTHIRVLVFSRGRVESVNVSVNGVGLGQANHVQGPLYVVPWQPSLYSTGFHSLRVHVLDSLGNEKTVEQPFALDNSKMPFSFIRRYILMAYHADIIFCIYVCTFLGIILLPMCIRTFKRKTQLVLASLPSHVLGRSIRHIIYWLYLLTCCSRVYFSVLFFNLYTAFGPHFIGYMTDEDIGWQFPFGIYLKGTFIPAALTYAYAVLQFVTFNMPMMLYLGHCLDLSSRPMPQGSGGRLRWLWLHYCFLLAIVWQWYFTWNSLQRAYGLLAVILSPVRTWCIPGALLLRVWALNWQHGPSDANVRNNQGGVANGIGEDK